MILYQIFGNVTCSNIAVKHACGTCPARAVLTGYIPTLMKRIAKVKYVIELEVISYLISIGFPKVGQ